MRLEVWKRKIEDEVKIRSKRMREEREKKKGGREINVDEEANRREDKWSGRWRKIDDRRK